MPLGVNGPTSSVPNPSLIPSPWPRSPAGVVGYLSDLPASTFGMRSDSIAFGVAWRGTGVLDSRDPAACGEPMASDAAALGVVNGLAVTGGFEMSNGLLKASRDAYKSLYRRTRLSPVGCCFRRNAATELVVRKLEAVELAEAVDRVLSCRFGAEAGRGGTVRGVEESSASTSSASLCSSERLLESASLFRRPTSDPSARHRRGTGASGGGDDIGNLSSPNRSSVQAV